MGRNDAVSKKYLSKNDVFADAVNYHFFGGQKVVRPEDLKEQDPEELALLFGEKGPVLEVMKVMEDRGKMAELMKEKGEIYACLPRDAAELIRVFAKIDIELKEEEEEINMCKAIDDMMVEAREIGREEGRESLMRSLFRRGVSFEVVSSCALQEGFTEDRLREIWESASQDVLAERTDREPDAEGQHK